MIGCKDTKILILELELYDVERISYDLALERQMPATWWMGVARFTWERATLTNCTLAIITTSGYEIR